MSDVKQFLRIKAVCEVTGLPKSTVYHLMKIKQFPQSFEISPGRKAWLADEVAVWQQAKLANRQVATSPEAAA